MAEASRGQDGGRCGGNPLGVFKLAGGGGRWLPTALAGSSVFAK